jgi:hypothetical protein
MTDRILPFALLALCCAVLATSPRADAADTVHVLVFMENGIGTASQAQKYVDKLVSTAKSSNGWADADGKYVTRRKLAGRYVKKKKPHYAFMSLAPYLAWRKEQGLEVLGVADVERSGGRRYHLVSKTESGLAGCKGKKLASNHLQDPKFIDRVVSGGHFTLGDFDVMKTRRPVQTLKKVIRGNAACALVDDAQLAELPHIDGSQGVRSVWKSAELPPMPVVAFSSAPAAERAKFKASLGSLCAGSNKTTCDKVGIRSIKPAGESTYAGVIKSYDK